MGGRFRCKVVTKYELLCIYYTTSCYQLEMINFLVYVQIYKKELCCFWDYSSPRALVKMCQTKQYPPRFILEANGCRATEAVVARVSFPGTKEFFKRTVPTSNVTLKCPPRGILL